MKKIFLVGVAIFTVVLTLSIGVISPHASERITDKGQKVDQAKTEKEAMIREGEALIKTGKMIEAEGKKTKDEKMIENGRLIIKKGQMMKEGKLAK